MGKVTILKGAVGMLMVASLLFIGNASADTQDNATYVGEEVCGQCHAIEDGNFAHTAHAKIFRQNPQNDIEAKVCEACHGPGSEHATNPTDHTALIGFTKGWGTPPDKANARCLSCHSGNNRIYWQGSIHQVKRLVCSDCHNPMARFSKTGLLKKPSISETCFTCHQQQRAEFNRKSHMPLPEGKISCEDCHNPHGTSSQRLIKANSVNNLCYTCHAEKRGPFIWEHAPVRENCLNCHLQHGSTNDKLLKLSRPFLCYSCHLFNGNPGPAGGMSHVFRNPTPANGTSEIMRGRSCQNCHMQIHGSNAPNGQRFRR